MELKIDKNIPTLRELTLDKMRGAILSLTFQPGERLVERDLCEQLGVSRTIIREVLRHLETEGLVQNIQNRGPIVAQPSVAEAMEIYELRGMLEAMAARACAERPNPEMVRTLEGALDTIRQAYAAHSFEGGLLEATTVFYKTMFAAAGKPVAWQIVSSLNARINHLRAITTRSLGRDADGPSAMALIVEAVRQGEPERAASACKAHVATASEIASNYLTERLGKEEVFPFRGKGRRRNPQAKSEIKPQSALPDEG